MQHIELIFFSFSSPQISGFFSIQPNILNFFMIKKNDNKY